MIPNNPHEAYKEQRADDRATIGQPARDLKSNNLFSTYHLVAEVRERLHNLQNKLGSHPRPSNVEESRQQEVDPNSLVQVVSGLRAMIQEVCADTLTMIDEIEEDLL